MRRISRLAHPQDVTDHIAKNIELARGYVNRSEPIPKEVGSLYNYPPLKEIIVRESSGKCVYCESKILSNQFGELDHIIPKEKLISENNIEDIFNHNNLALTCNSCKNKKRANGQTRPLLSPYKNKPEQHLHYLGPMVESLTEDGRKLIIVLGLDERSDLLIKIIKRLREVENLIRDYERELDEEVKTILKNRIRREALRDKEYSLAVFNFLKHRRIV